MNKALAIGILAAVAASGCARDRQESGGPTVERDFQVSGFERIEVAGPYEVEVRTGAAPSVHASGSEKDLERMVVEVKGDRLLIHPRKEGMFNMRWSRHGKIVVAVTVPQLRGAAIAGSGGIAVDRVSGDDFQGEIAGSGDLRLAQVEVKQLGIEIAGSGEAKAAGRAAQARYEIAGSGDIDAGTLVAERAEVSIAGSGNVHAHATGTASVDIAGSGDVRMSGGAKCGVSKAGSGDVRCDPPAAS